MLDKASRFNQSRADFYRRASFLLPARRLDSHEEFDESVFFFIAESLRMRAGRRGYSTAVGFVHH